MVWTSLGKEYLGMEPGYSKDDIKGFECKHALYTRANDGSDNDLIAIKEVVHLNDGRQVRKMRYLLNYERDFYVTRERYRDHEDKKEWEDVDKLQRFTCRQSQLANSVARALGRPGVKKSLRQFARSQYLYGTDISTPTLVKRRYLNKFPECVSENSVAVLDIETDVVTGDGQDIICAALTFKDKVFFGYHKAWLTTPNAEERLEKAFDKYLGEYRESRGIHKLDIVACDTPGQIVREMFKRAHEWQPDFITIWNIIFDMPRLVRALEMDGFTPEEVFSDPSVPPQFQFFRYREAPAKKETAGGNILNVPFAERWHLVEAPASFYFIDSMCTYKRIRMAEQNESSYSLDAQLEKHLGKRKLKFAEADEYIGLDWHVFMQQNYKVEYGIYNIFDCIGVELFDEKLKDLAQTISIQSGHSEYAIFKSQPKRLVDDLYFFGIEEKGKIVAACSDQMIDDNDQYVIDPKADWIITLPSHLVTDSGLKVNNQVPNMSTLIFVHVSDLDVGSGLT